MTIKQDLLRRINERIVELRAHSSQEAQDAAYELDLLRFDVEDWDDGDATRRIPKGANLLLVNGVDLRDILSQYPLAHNRFEATFGSAPSIDEKKFIDGYQQLLQGYFERAITLLAEIAANTSPQLATLIQAELRNAQQQQTAAADAIIQRAEALEAADAPQADIVAQYDFAIKLSPQNQKAKSARARLSLSTSIDLERSNLEQLRLRLERKEILGGEQEYKDQLGRLQGLKERYAGDPAFVNLVDEVRRLVSGGLNRLRELRQQLGTAEQLGNHQQTIDMLLNLREQGVETFFDGNNREVLVEDWLRQTETTFAKDLIAKAEERLKTADNLLAQGIPSDALKQIDGMPGMQGAQSMLTQAERYSGNLAREDITRYRKLVGELETSHSQIKAEIELFDKADEMRRKAEDARGSNLSSAVNLLREARRIYEKLPGLKALYEEYTALEEQNRGFQYDAELFSIEVGIENAASLEELQEFDGRLNAVQMQMINAPSEIRMRYQTVKRKAADMIGKLKKLAGILDAVEEALKIDDMTTVEILIRTIPQEFTTNTRALILRSRVETRKALGNDPNVNALTAAYYNGRFEEVVRVVEQIDMRGPVASYVTPFVERARIRLIQKEVDALPIDFDTGAAQQARSKINTALTICYSLLTPPPGSGLDAPNTIQTRLHEKAAEIDAKLNSLGALGQLEMLVRQYEEQGEFRRAIALLKERLDVPIDDRVDSKNQEWLKKRLEDCMLNWYTAVRSHIQNVYSQSNPDIQAIFDAHRRFKELDEAGQITDSDNAWANRLRQDYHWYQAQHLINRRKEALEELNKARQFGLPESTEVINMQFRLEVDEELELLDNHRQNEGIDAALRFALERWQKPATQRVRRSVRWANAIFRLFELGIESGKSFDGRAIEDAARDFAQEMKQIDQLHVQLSEYWRSRMRILIALREERYSDYDVENSKFPTRVSGWQNQLLQSYGLISDDPEGVAEFDRLLKSTPDQLDSWLETRVEELLTKARILRDENPIRAVQLLSAASMIKPGEPMVASELSKLMGRPLRAIVDGLNADYKDIETQPMRLDTAYTKATRLQTTVQTIEIALQQNTNQPTIDQRLAQEIKELHRRVDNAVAHLQEGREAFRASVAQSRQALFERSYAGLKNAYDQMEGPASRPLFKYLDDVNGFMRILADTINAYERLDSGLKAITKAVEREDVELAEEASVQIRDAVMQLHERVDSLNRLGVTGDSGVFEFHFDNETHVVSRTEAQDLRDEHGNLLIEDGRIRGLDRHVEVTRQRYENSRLWASWWQEFYGVYEAFLQNYMIARFGTHAIPPAYDPADPPVESLYMGWGLIEAFRRAQQLQHDQAYTSLITLSNRMPKDLLSRVQLRTITSQWRQLLETYPFSDPSVLDANYLSVQMSRLPRMLIDLTKHTMTFVRKAAPDLGRQYQALHMKYDQLLNDIGKTQQEIKRYSNEIKGARPNRLNELRQGLQQAQAILEDLEDQIRQIEPCYPCHE